MSSRQKILIGALGAATPLALNLVVVDLLTLSSPTVLTAAGYAIRVAALIGLGTFIVFLNLDEERRLRIFQLGLAAPALVTALLNGFNQRSLLQAQVFVSPTVSAVLSEPIAYAAAGDPARQFAIRRETSGEQVWRGLTGSRSDRLWFVIARREPSRDAAEAARDRINRTIYGFNAEVFEPYQGHGGWCVVIGEGLTRVEAGRLRERALGAGLADAEVWTFPRPTT
jgi:hypothetical protein